MKVLIIEDSISLRRSLKIGLENLGFTIDETGDGSEGMSMALMGGYELLILDLMLPSLDGLEILKAIRREKIDLKILILSAKSQPEDKITGLLSGADDFLTKPFSFEELHARLLCLTRRGALKIENDKIYLDDFLLDLQKKNFHFNNILIDLTPNEYKIIECLFTNQNSVVSPEKLSDHITGQFDVISKNSIEVHLSSVRKKVKVAGGDLPITTKRGFGYIVNTK